MAESGRTLTYKELDDNSARLASALHADCDANATTCLDADRVLGRGEAGNRYFFRSDAHWNAAGHQRIAQALADWLVQDPALKAASMEASADSPRGTPH